MSPQFRQGAYGPGLLAGVSRVVARVAQGRNVTLQGVRPERDTAPNVGSGGNVIFALLILFILLSVIGRTRRRRRFGGWGTGGGSGWNSGVGPFGGGYGGFGRGGGGFGGGFGGFGGGRSGGGGGGAGWELWNAECRMLNRKAEEMMTRYIRSTMLVVLLLVGASGSSGCSYNTFVSKEE